MLKSCTFKLLEIKSKYIKYFVDGTIGQLTWGAVKRPQLEDRTINFKSKESCTDLSTLTKKQNDQIGFNPMRNEFELVCIVIKFIYLIVSLF